MKIVSRYEISEGRTPKEVHTNGVGYDILSKDSVDERYIEVKASSESWSTYTWLPLYNNEVKTLKKYPEKFYLYIVKFEIDRRNRNEESLNSANYNI